MENIFVSGKGIDFRWQNDQIFDMLRRNVARKLSQEEVNAYDGPVHYIAHQEVL